MQHRPAHHGAAHRRCHLRAAQARRGRPFTRDTQREALGVLVKAITGLAPSLYWGDGKTSASDGQRHSLRRKVLQKTYSPRFSDFALEFYSFVADNYAPFFSTPIKCTDRDAATVQDGLLYNESDLKTEEQDSGPQEAAALPGRHA